MQISLLTVVTFMNVLVSAESTFMRGGSTNSDKDTNSNHRSLALSECSDSGEVLYKDKTCDKISAINNKKKVKTICNKKTKLGRIYDLCPSTCSGVDLGPCTTSKLGETINSLRADLVAKDTIIAGLSTELSLYRRYYGTVEFPEDQLNPNQRPGYDYTRDICVDWCRDTEDSGGFEDIDETLADCYYSCEPYSRDNYDRDMCVAECRFFCNEEDCGFADDEAYDDCIVTCEPFSRF